jgi:putative transposase
VYKKITDIKRDAIHKLTSDITNSHGIVVMEDLRIKNMTASAKGTAMYPGTKVKQKSGLNRAILRNNWGEFERQVTYKLAWSGGQVIKVPPHYTSQTCHHCGQVNSKNRNGIEFLCLRCGHSDHADINAAKNILALGQSVSVCGDAPSGVLVKSKTRKSSVKQKPMVAQASGILGL